MIFIYFNVIKKQDNGKIKPLPCFLYWKLYCLAPATLQNRCFLDYIID